MDGSTNSLDDVSADSSAEFPDRVSLMEGRLQAQEDEITLLKSSLADALRRLRLHDQLIPLLKQQLISVNPAAARVLNQVCCPDGCSSGRKLSSSSVADGHRGINSSQVTNSHGENGHNGDSVSPLPRPRPPTLDRSTQTDHTVLGEDTELDRVPLALTRAVQSLSLEDAMPEGRPSVVAGARAKFRRIQGLEVEEEEEGEDEEAGGEGEKDLGWASSMVEEPIHSPTNMNLQKEDLQDPNGSPEDQGSAPQTPSSVSPAPPKDQVPSPGSPGSPAPPKDQAPRAGPLATILKSEKTPLVRRNSERLAKETQEKSKKRLDKKAASSANLLTRSPSLEK